MAYESIKSKRITLFRKFIYELQEDYSKSAPHFRTLNYDETVALLCERLNIFPKDVEPLIFMALQKGDLTLTKELVLGEKLRNKIDEQLEKNKKDIKKEIEEAGLDGE